MDNKGFKKFDGIEVSPMEVLNDKGERVARFSFDRQIEVIHDASPCGRAEAHFWTVFGHCDGAGVEAIRDFQSEKEAMEFAQKALFQNENLRKYGIYRNY